MLTIMVGAAEAFNEATNEFVMTGGTPLKIEHSLVSVSKWEASYEKPFLSQTPKTSEETLGYIRAMALDPDVPDDLWEKLTKENLADINTYVDAKMSATWFRDDPTAPRSREVITSEIVYYWMIALNIPFECQYWHLNRLLTLVKVCNQKNQPEKKMNRRDVAARNRRLNAERQQKFGTTG